MEKETKRRGRERAKTIEFWYRRKYGLTSTDPRFLDATLEEMETDRWAHHFFENPKAAEEVEDEDFNLEEELARIEAEAADDAARDVDDWEDVSS